MQKLLNFFPCTHTASAWAETCPVLDEVKNGRHRCTNDKLTPGTVCTLVCDPGYHHDEPCIGDNECVDDALGDPMWDMMTPLCIRKSQICYITYCLDVVGRKLLKLKPACSTLKSNYFNKINLSSLTCQFVLCFQFIFV